MVGELQVVVCMERVDRRLRRLRMLRRIGENVGGVKACMHACKVRFHKSCCYQWVFLYSIPSL